jgi:hypothetical protein
MDAGGSPEDGTRRRGPDCSPIMTPATRASLKSDEVAAPELVGLGKNWAATAASVP